MTKFLLIIIMSVFLFSYSCAQLPQSVRNWQDMEIRDVATDQTFKISDFNGKIVVVETMVLWCDACTRQQEEIAIARSNLGEGVVFITIDVDSDDSESRLQQYINGYGFDWIYVLASSEFNYELQSELGHSILSPPMSPIVIIDRDRQTHLLERGNRSAEELVTEISRYL